MQPNDRTHGSQYRAAPDARAAPLRGVRQNADAVASLAAEGAIGATSFADLVTKLAKPRTVWVMLPAGEITEAMVTALVGVVEAGNTISDGGKYILEGRCSPRQGADAEGIPISMSARPAACGA